MAAAQEVRCCPPSVGKKYGARGCGAGAAPPTRLRRAGGAGAQLRVVGRAARSCPPSAGMSKGRVAAAQGPLFGGQGERARGRVAAAQGPLRLPAFGAQGERARGRGAGVEDQSENLKKNLPAGNRATDPP